VVRRAHAEPRLNNTTLEAHAFRSDVRARDLFAIYLTNFIAIVLTFGCSSPSPTFASRVTA
jgi:uncharacterized membrane protein YjgN (DUF898 family)